MPLYHEWLAVVLGIPLGGLLRPLVIILYTSEINELAENRLFARAVDSTMPTVKRTPITIPPLINKSWLGTLPWYVPGLYMMYMVYSNSNHCSRSSLGSSIRVRGVEYFNFKDVLCRHKFVVGTTFPYFVEHLNAVRVQGSSQPVASLSSVSRGGCKRNLYDVCPYLGLCPRL